MRIVFMGTPDIAATSLAALLDAGHSIVGVYTRQDKPQGRKREIVPSPVKVLAQKHGLPLFQPQSLKTPQAAGQLLALAPTLVVVVAYGLILPQLLLDIPKLGCINLHVSLLPQYRGAAPIQWAIINGQAQTGVCIIQMDAGLDTGAVLASKSIALAPQATAQHVFLQAAAVGAQLLVHTVKELQAGRANPQAQQGTVSYAPQLSKEMAEINFSQPAVQVHNLIRGCMPWPMAWFLHQGKRVKVLQSAVQSPPLAAGPGGTGQQALAAPPVAGQLLSISPLVLACGQGSLALLQVHAQGGRPMQGTQWAAGRRLAVGDILL